MTPRKRAILIVILALLLLGIIIGVVVYLLRGRVPTAGTPVKRPVSSNTAPAGGSVPAAQDPLNPPVAAVPARTAAAQMAELFAERYGSYSNQGDFQNLRDLLPVMTDGYRAKTEAYLATATAADIANYQGVTSLKISTEIRSYDEAGTAVIAVMLQQQKRTGGSVTPAITYRSLKMGLQKVGKEWRVDSATWEN